MFIIDASLQCGRRGVPLIHPQVSDIERSNQTALNAVWQVYVDEKYFCECVTSICLRGVKEIKCLIEDAL